MPELPDLTIYLEALRARVAGRALRRIRIVSPFLLRTVEPPPGAFEGREVAGLRRLGKRLVFDLDGGLRVAIHLMIAGRLHWKPEGAKVPGRTGLAGFDFETGTLVLTEAGSRRRASLHLLAGEEGLAALDRGGIEPLEADAASFRAALLREPHTLKRALTDPRLFAGIGNAYSDEILHRARLSPTQRSAHLSDEQIARLHSATVEILRTWIDRLRVETGDCFPEKVTAFRDETAVHGRYGLPCPLCGTSVQRIVYAENECNYCPRCQTEGRLLADRSLSRLLRGDWPKTIDELEDR